MQIFGDDVAKQGSVGAGRRNAGWQMAARCATALVGGYAAAAGFASLLARLMPVARAEATLWGMIVSFLLFACFGLWAFHEARLARVVAVIWSGAIAAGTIVALLGPRA